MADSQQALDRVMVIAAHPDDPEFGCAGTMVKWAHAGKQITYVLITSGDKGSHDPDLRPGRLAAVREGEQRAAAAELGVWMLNVHASGGRAMLEAAREAVSVSAAPPLLIAVTVLTSLDAADLEEIGCHSKPAEQVRRLAALTAETGLAGVVCSAQEAGQLRQELPALLRVTPGIRPAGFARDDQRRVLTPAAALAQSADYLVIGRPITAAPDPGAVVAAIVADMAAASVR